MCGSPRTTCRRVLSFHQVGPGGGFRFPGLAMGAFTFWAVLKACDVTCVRCFVWRVVEVGPYQPGEAGMGGGWHFLILRWCGTSVYPQAKPFPCRPQLHEDPEPLSTAWQPLHPPVFTVSSAFSHQELGWLAFLLENLDKVPWNDKHGVCARRTPLPLHVAKYGLQTRLLTVPGSFLGM